MHVHVYSIQFNSHLREPVTVASVTDRLAVELSLAILTTKVCPDLGSNPNFPQSKHYDVQTNIVVLCDQVGTDTYDILLI